VKRLQWIGIVCGLCLLWGIPTLAQDTQTPDDTLPEEPERCTLAFEPEDVDLAYYVGRGDVRFRQGNLAPAIEAYTCALILDPDYIPAINARGYAYFAQGNDEAALIDFNRVLELDEANVLAYTNRGVLYTKQGRFGLAFTDFDVAIALAPDLAVAYNNRAVLHAIEHNYDLAMGDVQQAITLAPDYAQPHATLGMIYSALAVQSYATYKDIRGGDNPRLPSGTPDNVIIALNDSLETGSYFVWIAVQSPAR